MTYSNNNSPFNTRQIFYVVLMTSLFLGMNYFFSYQQDQKNREILKQRKEKLAEEQLLREKQYGTKEADLNSFPIVSLTKEGQSIQKGVRIGDQVITIAWSSILPKTLNEEEKTLTLLTPNVVKGSAALYGPEGAKPLDVEWLSQENQEVQLISFLPQNHVSVIYGEFRGSNVVALSGVPTSNMLVFTKKRDAWEITGLYSYKEESYTPLALLPNFSEVLELPKVKQLTPNEDLYVLENDFLQLVFSAKGGALSEINLPFKSQTNKWSVVNPIEFDKEILETSPKNALFPLRPYFANGERSATSTPKKGGYYPLIRRDIIGLPPLSAELYSCNLVSNYPDLPELTYSVKEFTKERVVFEARQPNRVIKKSYTLPQTKEAIPYLFQLDLTIEGDARGLFLTSGIPEVELISNAAAPIVEYRFLRGGKGDVEKISLPKAGETSAISSIQPQWLLNSNGYLGVIQRGAKTSASGFKVLGISGEEVPTRLTLIDPKYRPYPANKYPGYQTLIPLPSQGGTLSYQLYAGPFEEATLQTVDRMLLEQDGVNPNFRSAKTFHGWFTFISRPFAKLLFIVMSFFHTLTGSWGLSIIFLTVFLRVLLYPLNAWSYKSMKRMQLLSPQAKAIQNKYKKDPKKAQAELMDLYKKHNVNPFMGCFPILIQFPFLVAMFDLLKSSFQLRGANFIPGWIENLTAPDVLFSWATPIFFFGTSFHLLPVILGLVMFLQQRLMSPLPKDPSQWTDQQRQQRAMGTMMAVVFFVMFYNFPSGLNLYWLSSMVLGIGQQWLTNRSIGQVLKLEPENTSKKK